MTVRVSGGWLVAAVVVLVVVLPMGAFAAGSLVEISSPSGRRAGVTTANQLFAAEASPGSYKSGGASSSFGVCSLVMAPSKGKALIVKTVAYNVYINPTPDSGNWVALFKGDGCETAVDSYNPSGTGRHQAVFEPGIAIPAGHGLYTKTQNNVQSEVYAHGYEVQAAAVPAPPTVSGQRGLPRNESD